MRTFNWALFTLAGCSLAATEFMIIIDKPPSKDFYCWYTLGTQIVPLAYNIIDGITNYKLTNKVYSTLDNFVSRIDQAELVIESAFVNTIKKTKWGRLLQEYLRKDKPK